MAGQKVINNRPICSWARHFNIDHTGNKLRPRGAQSLTWDRGKEMTDHTRFTLATDITVYLCDPPNPWQRGSNENTNVLLRQYFPKETALSLPSQAKLNAVARRLNERPRKTLDYEAPAEQFNHVLRRSVETAAISGRSVTVIICYEVKHLLISF